MLRGPYKKKYNPISIANALQAVRQDGMKHGTAAKRFGIPKTTLLDRLKGRVADHSKMGAPTILTTAEEQKLCRFIEESARLGFPLQRNDFKRLVKDILDKDGRPNRLKDNTPGTYISFMLFFFLFYSKYLFLFLFLFFCFNFTF